MPLQAVIIELAEAERHFIVQSIVGGKLRRIGQGQAGLVAGSRVIVFRRA